MRKRLLLTAMLVAWTTASVCFAGGAISVHAPWVREAPPNAPMAGYMELRNGSSQVRALVGATAEGFANTMVHRTEYSEGRASMVHVDKVEIAPNTRVAFEPGGLHIMLMRPQRRVSAGDVVTIRLQFDDGTFMDVIFPVRKAHEMDNAGGDGQGKETHHHEHHQHGERTLEVNGDAVPTLELSVQRLASGAWALQLETTNFRFSREHADGPHLPGEGHAHLYVDGKKITRLSSNQYELGALSPGTHAVVVGLYTNDHAAYAVAGSRVEQRQLVRIEQ